MELGYRSESMFRIVLDGSVDQDNKRWNRLGLKIPGGKVGSAAEADRGQAVEAAIEVLG